MTPLKSQLKFQLKNSFRLNSSFLFELEFTLGIKNYIKFKRNEKTQLTKCQSNDIL